MTHFGSASYRLPGVAASVVFDGDWRNENPAGWLEFIQGTVRSVGRGSLYIVTLTDAVAEDLRQYLLSVQDVLESMSATERGGNSELRAVRQAVERLNRG